MIEGVGATTQHKTTARPDEAACQGRHCHTVAACHCVGLHLGGRCMPQCGAAQVCNEQGLLGHVAKVQRFGKDQARLGRGPHTFTTSTQVENVAIV